MKNFSLLNYIGFLSWTSFFAYLWLVYLGKLGSFTPVFAFAAMGIIFGFTKFGLDQSDRKKGGEDGKS